MKKLILITFGKLALTFSSTANYLPDNVMNTVLKFGVYSEITYHEVYEEEGLTIYEVRLDKGKHEIILLIDKDGYVLEKIKEKHFDDE